MAREATSERLQRGRGRGRGRDRGRSGGWENAFHQSQSPRYAGQEHSGDNALKRIVSNFCSTLYGAMRVEAVHGLCPDSEHDVSNADCRAAFLDHSWLVIVMIEAGDDRPTRAPGPVWRLMRDKLEAMSVLSVLACTESYAWRRNVDFWKRFVEDGDRETTRDSRAKPGKFGNNHFPIAQTPAIPALRDDTLMPRFLLDFSFSTVSANMLMLVRRVLLGSEMTMRINFINAMAALATVPPRTPRSRSIQVSLRFTRCKLEGRNDVTKLVELVLEVNRCRKTRQRELSKTTSKIFYYQIVELDLTGVELSVLDLQELSRLCENTEGHSRLRLVLDKTAHVSADSVVPFGTLAMSWFQPAQPTVRLEEPEAEASLNFANIQVAPCSYPSVVAEASLNTSSLSSLHITSLLSAVGASGSASTQNLSLRNAFHCCDTELAWAWLAFSVCGGESTSRLVALDLSSNPLQHSDTVAVKRIMVSKPEDRLKVLQSIPVGKPRFQNKAHTGKAMAWVSIPAGTGLSRVAQTRSKLMLGETVVVRVVDMREDHAVVLVPAYGFLYAATAAVIPVEVEDTQSATCQLKDLRLNGMLIDDDDNADAVMGSLFSSLAIPTLLKLELNGNRLGQATLRAVLAACPQLKSLSVEECELQSISALLGAYSRGVTRVESLNLAGNHISNRDVVELCRLIVDSGSPASQIRSLNLSGNPIGPQSLRALSAVLRNSQVLAQLVLDRAQDVDSAFRPTFYQFHNQPLGFEPLPEDRKAELNAALLALACNETLDSSVVDHICEYAGSDRRRQVIWK